MQTQIRQRNNLLGETRPENVNVQISHLLLDSDYLKYNLRPVYQRHIRWSKNAMNDFIGNIMNNGLVPPIIQYKLSNEEKVGKNQGKSYEIVDGQHRLFTLKAFYDATYKNCPHIKNNFIVYWNYEPDMPVFYKDTRDVQSWCLKYGKVPSFLTDDEKEYFDSFIINIIRINSQIDINKRREMFMSMQKGIPVRNSDLLKNKTDCKFIAFINENNYEEMMNDTFLQHCTKNAINYWVNWSCRCFFLWKATTKTNNEQQIKDACIAFSTTDNTIGKRIMSNSNQNPQTRFNPSDNDLDNFDDAFRSFISFLQNENIQDIKFNPTQIFALFYRSCLRDINEIISHMYPFSQRGISKNNVWESNTDSETRKEYFKECVEQIKEYYPPPPMLHEEAHIPMPTMLHEEAEDYYEIREF